MQLFEKYPPSVARVLKLDPSLLVNSDYLNTYPALNSFLVQHPEIGRSPGYYLERIRTTNVEYVDSRSNSSRLIEDILGWIGGITAATLVVLTLTWIIRTFVDYRRWYRLSKVQTEAHNKILDRMTSNEDMVAYVKSPAGSRFLEPPPLRGAPVAEEFGQCAAECGRPDRCLERASGQDRLGPRDATDEAEGKGDALAGLCRRQLAP